MLVECCTTNDAGGATLTLPAINSTADSGVAAGDNDPNSANNLGASLKSLLEQLRLVTLF